MFTSSTDTMSCFLHILLVSHISICIGINCINVQSEESCGCGTLASTWSWCPDGYTIVGCGSRTLDASADAFRGQFIDQEQRCTSYGTLGDKVYAIARCCDFSSYAVQCDSHDWASWPCTSEQTMMSCSGEGGSSSYYMGQWVGDWSE
eukprot:28129_1